MFGNKRVQPIEALSTVKILNHTYTVLLCSKPSTILYFHRSDCASVVILVSYDSIDPHEVIYDHICERK